MFFCALTIFLFLLFYLNILNFQELFNARGREVSTEEHAKQLGLLVIDFFSSVIQAMKRNC